MRFFFLRLSNGNGLRWLIYSLLALFAAYQLLLSPRLLKASPSNGFDLSNSEIPARKIEHGGPPRDGIPALNRPRIVAAEDAGFMHDSDRVVGLDIHGGARAYPVKILNYHELVNDRINGEGILISYCPLCGTAMAFRSNVDGRDLRFGVSGLLYNSDVLMYDHQTDSLWSQILGRAISGPSKGAELKPVPVIHTTWKAWLQAHPQSKVLSTDTGYNRDYSRNPYAGYGDRKGVWFSVSHHDRRYSNKEYVIGLEANGVARAWPFSELQKALQGESHQPYLRDQFNGLPVRVYFEPQNRSAHITDDKGQLLDGIAAYWFAWVAFHPDTRVFVSQK